MVEWPSFRPSLGRGRSATERGAEGEVVLTYDTARVGSVARARRLRRDSTDAERKLWRALRSKLSQFKWRRQMPVGPYFADFACFAEKLIVEVDGDDVLANTAGVLDRIALELSTSPSRDSVAGPPLSPGRGITESV